MSYGNPPPPPPPPPGGNYGGPYQPAPGAGAAGTNGKAIASLVCGLVGLICCGLVSIAALILGVMARNETAASGQGGRGMATAGFVLGIVGIFWLVVSIILASTGHFYYHFSSHS